MPHYLYFFIALATLILGYFTYGKLVEKIFNYKDIKEMPAITKNDGVDFVPMSEKKLFLIQILNIAGLGPIFGPILGALYGPIALLWVVIGCIFAGAVHDYFSGMLSIRYAGLSMPEIVGEILGNVMRRGTEIFSVVLLTLIGVVFVAGPAAIIAEITDVDIIVWIILIFIYYILATLLPVNKIIGKIYPFFGMFLFVMTLAIVIALFFSDYPIYHSTFLENFNQHPEGLPIWPMVFITIACGAVSGFHCTQSTITARCLTNPQKGKHLFYGAMIAEGIIALIWVTLGMSIYQSPEDLNATMGSANNAALVVKDISFKLLGLVGGTIAIIGVIILPITSGDTAFRSARLLIADAFKIEQKDKKYRLYIAFPLFTLAIVLTFVDFSVVWRYFGWANQTVAAIMLWTAAVYLYKRAKCHWICSIPAVFMTAVTVSYIAFEKNIGFGLPYDIANSIGIISALTIGLLFLIKAKPKNN